MDIVSAQNELQIFLTCNGLRPNKLTVNWKYR